jgi:RNA polymerase sigma-70 factor (ECF subfamily)
MTCQRCNRTDSPGVNTGVADQASFEAFYRASRQRVYACLFALTGDPSEAQDAVHEAYARAWQRWSRLERYDDPEAWVRTVARRVAVSHWRRARNRVIAQRRVGEPTPLPGPDPDTVALVTALGQLPLAQRTAIVLHHLVGLPVAEVAAETGVAEGTVKARLSRGRRTLAGLLDATEETYVRAP